MKNGLINEIIFVFLVILCGSTIKRTIKEEYPEAYEEAMKTAPFYVRWFG